MHFRRILSACSLLALTLVTGCPSDKKDPSPTCAANGATCAAPAECCSAFCDPAGNVCANAPTCTDAILNGTETGVDCGGAACVALGKTCADGLSCVAGSDCTSGYCDATNHCATQCKDNNSSCTTGTECCSTYCDPAKKVCANPCLDNGQGCTTGTQCCTGFCDTSLDPDACATPTTCTANGLTCAVGTDCCSEYCDATKRCANPCAVNGTACAAGGECCSGFCDATSHCATPCTGNGLSCAFGSDCCSGFCDANKLCATPPVCKDLGVSCSADADCCDGYCNPTTDVCATPVTACFDAGTTCAANAECCSSACNTTTHTCTSTAFCQEPGEACANSSECCSLSCVGGVCSDDACNDVGTACALPGDCCSGVCTGNLCAVVSTTASCTTLGNSCAEGSECCSTNCQGGVCIPAFSCHAAYDICYRDEDCCSGMCDADELAGTPGRCILPSGGCNQGGNPCSGPSTCCSRLCEDPGSGVTVCKAAGGCRLTGDYCDSTQSCCGGSPDTLHPEPNPYGVYCDTDGVRDYVPYNDPSAKDEWRCSAGQACNPPGNICGALGDNASQNCCDGKKAVCKADSQGIARCFGGGSVDCPTGYDAMNPLCCIDPGEVCQFRDQCCNFAPCVPGTDGVLRCTLSACTPLHDACAGADDDACCAGTVCTYDQADAFPSDFTCEVPVSCSLNGDACSVASDCCSSNCVGGVCAPPCVNGGGSCTIDGDCCSGLSCDIAPGATSGTCQAVSSCVASGAACDGSNPCCLSTEACLDGVCKLPPTCKNQFGSCTTTANCCETTPALTCMLEDGTACPDGATTCLCDSCSPVSGSCATSADCCLGLDCNGGVCGACATLDVGCTFDGTTDTCCDTLHCSDPDGNAGTCTTPGTCTCDSCIPWGQSCTFGGPGCCGMSFCAKTGTFDGCGENDLDCTCVENS